MKSRFFSFFYLPDFLSLASQTSGARPARTSPELPRPPRTSPELPRPPRTSPDLSGAPQTSPDLSRAPHTSPDLSGAPQTSPDFPRALWGNRCVRSMEHQWESIKVNENHRKLITNQWRRYAHLRNPKHKFMIPY